MGDAVIRVATREDWGAMLPMLLAYHAECGLAPLDIEKVEAMVFNAIDQSLMVIVEEDGEIAGILGIAESAPWYSDTPIYGDFCHYIAPKWRGNGVERQLVRAAVTMMDAVDGMLLVSRIDPARMQKLGRVAEIEGFASVGYTTRLR